MSYEQINVHKSVSPKNFQEKFHMLGETCNLKFSISNNGLHLNLITEFNMISKFKVNPSYIQCILWHSKEENHGPVENRAKMFRQNKNVFTEDGFIVQWVVGSQ